MTMWVRFLFGSLAAVLAVGPIPWLIGSAFRPTRAISSAPMAWSIDEFGFDNFVRLFVESAFLSGLYRSLFVAGISTLVATTLAVVLAHAVARSDHRFVRVLDHVSVLAYSIPPLLLVLPLFVVFSLVDGMSETLSGLIVAHVCYLLPFCYWIMRKRVQEVPGSLEESLMLEGARPVDLLRFVWLPHLRVHLFSVAALAFTISMNDYAMARFLMISDVGTLPLVIQNMWDLADRDWGLLCAASSVSIVLLTVPFVFLSWWSGRHYTGARRG